MSASPGDDLGWNDMGDEQPPVQAVVQAIQPAPEPIAPAVPVAPPPVLAQRAAIEETFAVEVPAPKPAPVRAPKAAPAPKSKAAFTLRLDAERHLKLRLASAVRHQSAQLLVTQALDHFLESLTDVDALARQLHGREGRD